MLFHIQKPHSPSVRETFPPIRATKFYSESTSKDDELTIERVKIDRPPNISPLRHQGRVPPLERETSFCRPESLQC